MSEHHVDNTGSKFGMWLFLYSELMLFGGLFVLYAAYYYQYTTFFISGGKQLDLFFGTMNTVILLLSSFTVACSIEAMRKNSKKLVLLLLGLTVFFGILFLCNKYIEWNHKFQHGIYPGSAYMEQSAKGLVIFFGLYFTMTGLHALHLLIGLIVIGVCFFLCWSDRINAKDFITLDNSGLYWHLIDVIWIFLFPLFYLIL